MRFYNSCIKYVPDLECFKQNTKYQFLFHVAIDSCEKLGAQLHKVVTTCNTIGPQMNLGGNTAIELSQYTHGLKLQKAIRL
jgi:hypothetical protein